MASRRRENGEGSGSNSHVAPPLFLSQEVRIKDEEEDELFGQSDLSEDDGDNYNQNDKDDQEQDQLEEDAVAAAGLNGFADGHTNQPNTSKKAAAKPRKSKGNGKAKYELREYLDAPRSLTLSCEILNKRVMSGTVDVNPEYQRDTVWSQEKQSALIDSIFRRYYVPPILFSKVANSTAGDEEATANSNRRSFNPTIKPPPKRPQKSNPTASGSKRKRKSNDDDDDFEDDEDDDDDDDDEEAGADRYVCIDGKQRLSSIINFMNNHIPVIDPKTKGKYYFKEDSALRKTGIPAKYRKIFEDSQMTVVEYSNLTLPSEREMFSRVQMGVTLSPAEKLKAQPGEWAKFFREMASKYMRAADDDGSPLLGSIVETKRGNDYKCILQFGLIVIKSKIPNFAPMTGELTKWGKTEEALQPLDKKLSKGIEDALILFKDLLQREDEGVLPEARWNGQPSRRNLAPIEWVYVAVFIWATGSKLVKRHTAELTNSLKRLRAHVRNKHPDVMWKTGIAKDYREFIKAERGRLTEAGLLSSEKKKQKT